MKQLRKGQFDRILSNEQRLIKNILIGMLPFLISTAYAAGFDCQKARTVVDKDICSTPTLSAADDALNYLYRQVYNHADDKNTIKKAQLQWIKQRNRCSDKDCLIQHYHSRLQILSTAFPTTTTAKQWREKLDYQSQSSHEYGALTIKTIEAGGFNFLLFRGSGGNSGEIEGQAFATDTDKAIYFDEQACLLHFSKAHKAVTVKANKCQQYAGVGVVFDGVFSKKVNAENGADNANDHFLLEQSILSDSQQLAIVKQLLKDDYQTFLKSFQSTTPLVILDDFSATAFSSDVRGLLTIVEVAIMHTPDNHLYIAFIDGDAIKYFSNDAAYQNRLPKTFADWRERLAGKKLIFMNK